MIKINVSETDYFLPEDGDVAKQDFLSMFLTAKECYLSAYSFTLQPLFDELAAAEARGVTLHILLDHSQEGGVAEASKVKDLFDSMKQGDITITTAGINSKAPRQIWHWKGAVSFDGKQTYLCWEGSVNFSQSGFLQGNSARSFSNTAWAYAFIAQFKAHRAWARDNEPQYQL